VRVKIVFVLLVVLLGGLGFMLVSRDRAPHQMPLAPSASASASPAGSGSAALLASASASGSATPPDAGPVKLMDRPLRTVTLGWDLAAPAVLANGGVDPGTASDFTAAGLEVHVRAVDAMSAVEAALARGGADKDGADVAVVPFCELVASYERLRALTPEAFFVVGWSRGREALVSTQPTLPAPTDRPALGADAKGAVSMVGTGGEAATFLGLYALDANGTPPGAVRLVPPGGKPDDPPLAAVDRDAMPADGARRTILLTTADASRLIPFVAVAQHGLLDKQGRALAAWARVWLEGAKKLADDPPTAARQIATSAGAPEPIALLKRLGEITPASLGDNARAVGLSGRGALSLETLFQQSWQIWRGAGVLATPAPDAAPINTSVIAALARANPSLIAPPPPSKPAQKQPAGADARAAMITFRQLEGKLDEPALVLAAGLFADVFERSTLRVAVVKGASVDAAATKKLIDGVEQRFDVTPGRLVAAKKVRPSVAGAVEILAAP
jgi:hypothetical protein